MTSPSRTEDIHTTSSLSSSLTLARSRGGENRRFKSKPGLKRALWHLSLLQFNLCSVLCLVCQYHWNWGRLISVLRLSHHIHELKTNPNAISLGIGLLSAGIKINQIQHRLRVSFRHIERSTTNADARTYCAFLTGILGKGALSQHPRTMERRASSIFKSRSREGCLNGISQLSCNQLRLST